MRITLHWLSNLLYLVKGVCMVVVFCGHRTLNDRNKIKRKLANALIEIFKEARNKNLSVSCYCGGYGEFDNMVSNTIDELRSMYKDVIGEKLLVIAYPITVSKSCESIMSSYDSIVYPPIENVPMKFAIVKRNEWMVKQSDVVVAYCEYQWGGAYKMMKLAEKIGKKIIYL